MTAMEARPGGLSRDVLIDAILEFLADQDLLTLRDIRGAREDEIDSAGPEALMALKAHLTADRGWDYCPRDPLAQRSHHLLVNRFPVQMVTVVSSWMLSGLLSRRRYPQRIGACIETTTAFPMQRPYSMIRETWHKRPQAKRHVNGVRFCEVRSTYV